MSAVVRFCFGGVIGWGIGLAVGLPSVALLIAVGLIFAFLLSMEEPSAKEVTRVCSVCKGYGRRRTERDDHGNVWHIGCAACFGSGMETTLEARR